MARLHLFCLFYLLTVGCTATSVTPETTTPLSAPITANVTITTPTNRPTPWLTPTPSPTPTPLSATNVWQTQTAFMPAPTSTPTPTPRPTFTPALGPVWRILFSGVPCPADFSRCDNDLYIGESSRWYLINSDGSGLIALKDTDTFLTDLWGYPRISPDGTHLAYLARSEVDNDLHIMLAEISEGTPIDLGVAPEVVREMSFLPEPGCLAVYTSPRVDESPEVETITITKVCVEQPEHQVLRVIEFPNLRPAFNNWYRLSPGQEMLLVYGASLNDTWDIYVWEFDTNITLPGLVVSQSKSNYRGSVRWHPDGQRIEFVTGGMQLDGTVLTSFYVADPNGENLMTRLDLTAEFAVPNGDWSPDGYEFAFSLVMPDLTPELSGIYVLDMESGVWQQILSEFYITLVHTWQLNFP